MPPTPLHVTKNCFASKEKKMHWISVATAVIYIFVGWEVVGWTSLRLRECQNNPSSNFLTAYNLMGFQKHCYVEMRKSTLRLWPQPRSYCALTLGFSIKLLCGSLNANRFNCLKMTLVSTVIQSMGTNKDFCLQNLMMDPVGKCMGYIRTFLWSWVL